MDACRLSGGWVTRRLVGPQPALHLLEYIVGWLSSVVSSLPTTQNMIWQFDEKLSAKADSTSNRSPKV